MNQIQNVEEAILTVNPEKLESLYTTIFQRSLDTGCQSCWRDALLALTNWIRSQDEAKADINLFTMVYKVQNRKRQAELDQCLKMNQKLRDSGRIRRIIKIKDFVTFEEIFGLTKKFPDDINIIANSDVFFNDSIEFVHDIKRLEAYCLSRYDYNGKGQAVFFDRCDSQDAWIFRGHVRNVKANFQQGRAGCDNRLAYELQKTGFEVLNPSLSIQTIHLHRSKDRRRSHHFNRINRPYLLVYPHKQGQKAAKQVR